MTANQSYSFTCEQKITMHEQPFSEGGARFFEGDVQLANANADDAIHH
jgi:hypothetical protein